MEYWESNSANVSQDRYVRVPRQFGMSVWEWAEMLEDMPAGGSAMAVILRPDENGILRQTSRTVRVNDARRSTDYWPLPEGCRVKIDWHPQSNWWFATGFIEYQNQ
jgi:hypothetical protein